MHRNSFSQKGILSGARAKFKSHVGRRPPLRPQKGSEGAVAAALN